jgi:hypothetical protein
LLIQRECEKIAGFSMAPARGLQRNHRGNLSKRMHGENQAMSQRQYDLLRMRDMLEHLHLCHQQLEIAEEPEAVTYLTDTMLRNLEGCRRLCKNLHQFIALRPLS